LPAPNNVYTTQILSGPILNDTLIHTETPPDGYVWIVTDVDLSVSDPVDAPLNVQFGPAAAPWLYLPSQEIYVADNQLQYGVQWRGRMFIPADQQFFIIAEFSGGNAYFQVTGYVLKLP
jgi:hypothetical protein